MDKMQYLFKVDFILSNFGTIEFCLLFFTFKTFPFLDNIKLRSSLKEDIYFVLLRLPLF